MTDDRKKPSKPVPTSASTEQLLAHYNAQCAPYNEVVREKFAGDEERIESLLMTEIPDIDLVVSREVLIDRIRRQNLRLGRTVVARSHELLKHKVADAEGNLVLKDGYTTGLTYQSILDTLDAEFPEGSTSVACLRWYSVHMKADAADQGLPYPDLPQYRPRSSKKKAA